MEIIGTIMLVLGIAGMVIFYFTYLGGRKVSPKMHSLSVISTIIGICAFFVILTHWPIGIAKLVMLWLALMVAVIPTIVGCILDSKHGYQVSQKFNFWTHAGFIVWISAIVVGLWLHSANNIKQVKKIERVYTEHQVIPYSDKSGHIGNKDELWVLIVTKDGKIIPVSKFEPGIDFQLLYPKGDTISVLNGQVLYPRHIFK